MSDRPDDAWLIALGNDVSDGKPVDWASADRRAADEESKALVSSLRILESVVQAHRSGGNDPPSAGLRGASAATRHWQHLVLFEKVGAGAFGTVYRAWDTKVDREVALKLLPAGASSSRSPLTEARNLARIRHPNIVTVYGAGQEADQVGIWMEFIQGETLAEIVRSRGPMSAREAVGVGSDLCGALSALQSASLLHRDVKAHNVMREVGGRIVLMDFSGAWRSEAGEAPRNLSGTPLYMAPELFEGHPASPASDIYSLGVLLFYLLSGRLPIEAPSLAEIKTAHARGARTRLRDLRPELPEAVIQVVERAAASDPRERYHTAGALDHALIGTLGGTVDAHALDGGEAHDGAAELRTGEARRRGARRRLVWAAAAIGGMAATALTLGALRAMPPVDPMLVRFGVGPPDNTGSWPRLSPDGRLVVYGTAVEGRDTLWVREIGTLEGRPIPYTSARESPFWSADSRHLAFFEKGKLKRVAVADGEPPLTLADVVNARGGDWNQDDTLIFSTATGIGRMRADGTALAAVTTLDASQGEYAHWWPEFLPDGRRFLYLVRSKNPEVAGLYIGRLDSRDRTRIMPDYSRAVYSREGYLVFARDGTLFAQRFDERAERLIGVPQALASGVKHHTGSDGAFDVAGNGVLIYRAAEGLPTTRLMLLDRTGRQVVPVSSFGAYRHPRFSPDGQRIVVEAIEPQTENPDLWLFEHANRRWVRFTNSDAPDVAPAWSPDGREIVFSSKRGSRYEVFSKAVDVVTAERVLPGPDADKIVEDWSPDGKSLVSSFMRGGLWVQPLANMMHPRLIRPTSLPERWLAEYSPDGRWLAYTEFESGTPEVFVEPVDGSGGRWQVSVRGGAEPHWRRDGHELFYLTLDSQIASVRVPTSPEMWPSRKVETLFRVAVPEPAATSDYDVSPDGQMFVVNTMLGYPAVPPVQVLVNWTLLIKQ